MTSERRNPRDARGSQKYRGKPPAPGRDRRDRSAPRDESPSNRDAVPLSKAIIRELEATARPGKAESLVKVFGQAAQAFLEEDYTEAIRLGEQSKQMALRSASVREVLGLAYYRAGKWSETVREISTFRRIAGTQEQNHVLADAYRAMKKPDKALELIDQVEKGRVDEQVFFEAQIVAAGALADLGDLDRAIARLEKLDLRPSVAQDHHLRTWYVLADLLEKRGRYTQAKELFDAVTGADADITDAPERAARLASGSN